MNKNQKRKVAGGAVYVFCAFMLVSILTVAMLTAISSRRNQRTAPETSAPPAKDTASAPVTDKADDLLREKEWEITPETTPPDTDHNIVNGTEPVNQTAAVPYSYNPPVNGTVSKRFSSELAVWSSTMNDYRAHLGVDIDAPQGEAVSAFADGVISAIYSDGFMGDCICIEHSGGMKSYYMNLSGEYPEGIEPGAEVSAGQVIGAVGSGAKTEAYDPSHLHFEVTVNGEHVDPLEFVEIASADTEYEDE